MVRIKTFYDFINEFKEPETKRKGRSEYNLIDPKTPSILNKIYKRKSPSDSTLGTKDDKVFDKPTVKKIDRFKKLELNNRYMDVDILDQIYYMDISDVKIFSEWQSNKIHQRDVLKSKIAGSFKEMEKGNSILHYGWRYPRPDSEWMKNGYFNVGIMIKNGYPYSSSDIDEKTMYDIVEKMVKNIYLFRLGEIDHINPVEITDGILTDAADYWH